MQQITLVPYDETFLALSWEWLNDPETKRLTNTPDFSKESQLAWFQSLPGKEDYKVWGITCEGRRIGAAGLKKIKNGCAEYFVYIGDKDYWGKGLGGAVMCAVLDKAVELGLTHIYLNVIEENERAIRSYEKAGFSKTGMQDGQVQMSRTIGKAL
jgi:RimJ/RimL family protein N-acetyltransferase